MLEAEEKANKSDIAISRSGYMPRVSIYYNYGSDYSSNYRRLNPADSLYNKITFNDLFFKKTTRTNMVSILAYPFLTGCRQEQMWYVLK